VESAAKYRRDKRDTHRQNLMRSKELDEGSKTIKVTEFVTVGEIDYDGCAITKVIEVVCHLVSWLP
jgi:hypothetical protein